jgi:hypothetical protein
MRGRIAAGAISTLTDCAMTDVSGQENVPYLF